MKIGCIELNNAPVLLSTGARAHYMGDDTMQKKKTFSTMEIERPAEETHHLNAL
jgi:hypothetical protein